MLDTILFYSHYTITLIFGVVLSAAFCESLVSKKNFIIISLLFAFCGITQLTTLLFLGEKLVWQLYPLIVHLPLVFFLCVIFKKKIITGLASVSLAYMFCQPSKWFGLVSEIFIADTTVTWCIKIIIAFLVFIIALKYFASYISKIFNKDMRSVLIFGSVPILYYIFDYIVNVYTNLQDAHYKIATEFLAFSICIFFMLFCVTYYKEYEKKKEIEHKEQIIKIASEQQAKEIEAIKKSTLETSLLRHDMRLMLNNLLICLKQNDIDQALKTISGFVKQVDAAALHRYCKNDTINYILSYFESKCKEQKIDFSATVEIDELLIDEIQFSSIISNAIDNALNAQTELPVNSRQITLMLKDSEGKLLLSVKNPYKSVPVFVDGMPTTDKECHGYGTKSIRYMTEKLGGKCQFATQNNLFILRVIL